MVVSTIKQLLDFMRLRKGELMKRYLTICVIIIVLMCGCQAKITQSQHSNVNDTIEQQHVMQNEEEESLIMKESQEDNYIAINGKDVPPTVLQWLVDSHLLDLSYEISLDDTAQMLSELEFVNERIAMYNRGDIFCYKFQEGDYYLYFIRHIEEHGKVVIDDLWLTGYQFSDGIIAGSREDFPNILNQVKSILCDN